MIEIIKKEIEYHLSSQNHNQEIKRRPGRPSHHKDNSSEALSALYRKFERDLVNKTRTMQRSDAKTSSIARHIIKI